MLSCKKFFERLHMKVITILAFRERIGIFGGCLYYLLQKKNSFIVEKYNLMSFLYLNFLYLLKTKIHAS